MKHSVFVFAFAFALYLIRSDFSFADESRVLATDSIEIKQQSKNSLLAKEQALSIAMRKAFADLLKNRLEISETLPHFSEKEISDCVYDCSIENEKHSESTYICEVTYRFDESKVADLLNKHGIPYKTEKKPASNTKIAIYTDDFIKNSNKLDCVVEKFSSERVILTIKDFDIEEFKKLGIRYVQM